MGIAIFLIVASLLLSSSHADQNDVVNPIRLPTADRLNCLSWRLAVEAHNLRDWLLVPKSCFHYMKHYMLRDQYDHDCDVVADAASEFARRFPISGDGKDIWVFDADETLLSNLDYLAGPDVQFGTRPVNSTSFMKWLAEGAAPPLPAILRLYNTVSSLGFKTAILTGAPEALRASRIVNLEKAGYSNWETLILRGENDIKTSAVEYKSKKRTELVMQGYKIVGNVGDQWSDLIGDNAGNRTFKVPNPMYYVP